MRKNGLLHSINVIMVGMSLCMLTLFGSSCVTDDFGRYQNLSGNLSFDVKVQNNWTGCAFSATTGTSIRKMSQSSDAEPLYLVTKISEPTENNGHETITRGVPVTSTESLEKTGFGLSAICYTGTWPEKDEDNKWTTNFAHNLKMTPKDGTWKTDEKLEWVNSGRIRFFAYHPYSDNSEDAVIHSSNSAQGIPTLTYTVPLDVKEQPDLLYAIEDCAGDGSEGAVNLEFGHALTAITIKAGDNMLAGKITGIKILNVYGEGKYKIGSTWTPQGEPKAFEIKDINVDLSENKDDKGNAKPGTVITDNEFTFMMIPQTLPEDAQLIIYFTDEPTGTPRTLVANLKDTTWPVGKRVTYSVSSTGIVIEPVFKMTVNRNGQWPNGGYKFGEGTFDVANIPMTDEDKAAYLPVSGFLHDVDITAYINVVQEKAETKTLDLSFEIEYSTDGGINWNTNDGNRTYGWNPVSDATIKAVGESTKGTILLPAQPSFTASQRVFEGISTTEGKKDWDLVGNNTLSNHSANCYMVHDHGHYKFPAYYGNTYQNTDPGAYSCHSEIIDEVMKNKILKDFVAGDNSTVAQGLIQGIEKAVLIWQDSPDLVTEIEYKDGWVHFCVPQESLNQGNAVIAVLSNSNTILWSWHIWVTHYNWTQSINTGLNNEKGKEFLFAPSNLGYCTPHEGDKERPVLMRIKAIIPGKGEVVIKPTNITGVSQPNENGVIAFTQPAVIASIAGDNTYYQWGRKDPMLPGVYNEEIRTLAGEKEEQFDIANKVFYSTSNYRFTSRNSTVPIGATIRAPYHFFMYNNNIPKDENNPEYTDANYKRRHWHDGSSEDYRQKTIANFWNSQLIVNGKTGTTNSPNNIYVVKTVYDPSPAGYKVPPPSVFSTFAKEGIALGSGKKEEDANSFKAILDLHSRINIGWELTTRSGNTVVFPSTGLRDMGTANRTIEYGTWAAHSKLTFIATSGFQGSVSTTASSSTLLFSIDYRQYTTNTTQPINAPLGIIYGTNNAYGFSVRPIRDEQK